MVSMWKHPSFMCLGLDFFCVMWKSVFIHLLVQWIDSSHTESIHLSLWLLMNRFTFPWIVSHMNWLISVWIVSQNSLTCTESIHLKNESYHSSSWAYLNRFTHTLNRFILHAFLECLLLSQSIHSFSESIHHVVYVRNLCLVTPLYISSSPHNF